MITENDLQISNKSYINKDFPVIYQEIMDLAKKLSYKFDPETSNESDPFVIILKLLAFIGDKMNYNIDKNVLERFMPSATQESSMRDLCSMLGYNVKYYIAPTTSVTFKYTGNELDGRSFVLPKLETILTDDANEVSFVTTRDVSIYAKNEVTNSVPVIQGVVKTLTTLSGEVVRLENLDDNLRVYFPEKMVAQNGIFIEGGTISLEDEWTYVDNLNVTPPKSYVYTFGYDSTKRLPYLQFPDDIASLIGSGLTIKYVLTSGVDGNIKAKTLTKISSPTSITTTDQNATITLVSSDENNIVVKNINSSINGMNPESIDAAYSNFKKTIGTFDTLITCRDYMNYIYKLLDDDDIYPLVSNILVGDRRVDYNYSNNIVTYNQYGQSVVNAILVESDEPIISAFDLVLYAMNPIKIFDTSSYENSFRRLFDTTRIEGKLEESKCVSHNYKELESTDVFTFKNYYKLNAKISTTYKVNAIERADILNNINTALVKNFNAREVDFGYEIPYETLLSVMENADVRIKLVSLAEPELETKIMYADNSEESLFAVDTHGNRSNYIKLLAKNVLAGKVELFDYNELFDYDFGQEKLVGSGDEMLYKGVEKVTSEVTINPTHDGYTLKQNEVAQFIMPSLITDITYPYGIGLYLQLNSDKLNAGEEYKLQSGEYCVFIYTDTNGNQVVNIYENGDIVRANVDIYTTEYKRDTLYYTPKEVTIYDVVIRNRLQSLGIADEHGVVQEFILATQETVEHRELNQEKIDYQTYMYWMLNNADNELVFDEDGEYMLEEGEYLFRTDASFSDLISYGSGTVIKYVTPEDSDSSDDSDEDEDLWKCDKVSLEEINENGLLGLQDKFKYFDCNDSTYFLMREQTIYTAIEGDKLTSNDDTLALGNDFISVEGKEVAINGEKIPSVSIDEGYVKGRSRLDIAAGPTIPQVLQENQTMTFKCLDANDDDIDVVLTQGASFHLSTIKQLGGGVDVDLRTINYLVSEDDANRYILNDLYCYNLNTNYSINRTSSNYSTVVLGAGEDIELKIPAITYKDSIVMVYSGGADVKITPILRLGQVYYTFNNYYTDASFTDDKLNEGINIVDIYDVNHFKIKNESANDVAIIISKPRIINKVHSGGSVTLGYNKAFKLSSDEEEALREEIKANDSTSIFYYTNYVENVKAIETDDFTDPSIFYDYNNIANKWTIAEIDFSNSSIDIIRSSRV